MTWRTRLFLGWLALVVLLPVVVQLLSDLPSWAAYAPWASGLVALLSLALVVRPRSFNPLAWLADVAAAAANVLPRLPPAATNAPTETPKEPRS